MSNEQLLNELFAKLKKSDADNIALLNLLARITQATTDIAILNDINETLEGLKG